MTLVEYRPPEGRMVWPGGRHFIISSFGEGKPRTVKYGLKLNYKTQVRAGMRAKIDVGFSSFESDVTEHDGKLWWRIYDREWSTGWCESSNDARRSFETEFGGRHGPVKLFPFLSKEVFYEMKKN